jgi:pimeloyl-ACP methyl ester carboxylesterase
MRTMMPALWNFDARPWLRDIRTRTLILCGDSDPLVPLAHAHALHDGIAGSKLVILKDGGHSPVMQRRADLIQEVRTFIGSDTGR